ncbi:MAG: DUF885 domain-containing protein, partial [Burkholderiales bacterium]
MSPSPALVRFAFVVLFVIGCTPLATAKMSADMQLAAVLAQADEEDLKLNPQNALTRGDLRFADQFGDLITDDFLRKSEAQLREQLRQIRRVKRAALSAQDKIAYDVFRYQAEYALRSYTLGIARIQQKLPLDHIFGQHISFPQLSSGEGTAPYKTLADYENGLKRMDGFVLYLDRSINMMRRGIKSGHVQIRVVAEKIIKQLDEALAGGVDASPFIGPVKAFPTDFPEADKPRLDAEYRTAVSNKILPALKQLQIFLQNEYLAASRSGTPGLASMPDGAKLYLYALEQHTTTRLSAEEIHRLGLAEVARIRSDMQRIRMQVGFKGSLPEFFKHLQTDAQFQLNSKEDLIKRYGEINKRVETVLPTLFTTLPKSKLEIKSVPAEQESSAGGAYYVVGTP